MTRDNVLFALMGLLVGFVAAYLLYETVGEEQPPRLPAGQVGAAVAGAGTGQAAMPGVGAPGGAGPVNAPVMQQQLDDLRQMMRDNPDNPEGWLRLGNMAYDLQRWDVAVEGYRGYVERTGPDPDVLSDLAVSLHRSGETDEALAAFNQAQELAPDHWQSYFNEIVVLGLDLGRFDEAEESVERLRRLQPDNPDVQRLLQEFERRRDSA